MGAQGLTGGRWGAGVDAVLMLCYVSHPCSHRMPTWVDGSVRSLQVPPSPWGGRSRHRPAFLGNHLQDRRAPGSCLAAARDPSPPGTWGGKRSAQFPAIPPAHVVTLLGRTVSCTPAFPVASVHKDQVPFYLMTEPALTSAPFPGTESFCIWNAGILRVRAHPGVQHGSAAPMACTSQAHQACPVQPEQEASLCGQFRFE